MSRALAIAATPAPGERIWRFPGPLVRGTLVQRYKRFLADVRLEDGSEVTAHCPNSGSMATCSEPGRAVMLSRSDRPTRKLAYTLEMIHMGEAWVGVNTANPNACICHAVVNGWIEQLRGYDAATREVKYGVDGRSRIDLLLTDSRGVLRKCFVEVKNSTMRVGVHCAFPDAVTERGLKHLAELEAEVRAGSRAVMLFFLGRADCERFRPADEIDPAYGAGLRRAVSAGVEAAAIGVDVSPEGIRLLGDAPIDL